MFQQTTKYRDLQNMLKKSTSISDEERAVLSAMAPEMSDADINRFMGIFECEREMKTDLGTIGKKMEQTLREMFLAVSRGFELFRKQMINKAEEKGRLSETEKAEGDITSL